MAPTKICKSCGLERPAAEFNRNPKAADRLQRFCKPCHRADARACREKRPEHYKALCKRWRTDNKARARQLTREWVKANPARYKATQKAWLAKNRDHRAEYVRQYVENNMEKIRLHRKAHAALNRERIRESQGKKYLRNKEKIRAAVKAVAAAHPERTRAYKRKWEKSNPAYRNASTAKRYAAKTRSTPAWRNEFFIEEAYALAELRTKLTGFKWNVDHVVPLRSSVVCGLHVEHNLQVIPKLENCRKGNRIWPDMPGVPY